MLFLYVACVVLLGASFTCCVLVKIRKKTKDNRAMMIFLMGLFVVCMYDLGIYYCNYVVGMFSSTEVLRIGNCIIALTMYAWIVVQENIMKKDSLKPLGRMTKNYILFYTSLWLILTMATSVDYFYTMKWMLLLTDMILIVADELIPSGETSSFRSNPLGLAEFTLSRRDPEYVARAKAVKTDETEILEAAFGEISGITPGASKEDVEVGSVIYCVKPGDGSAREQAASCQRVLGGLANICREYATKRYRSNVMNWGMVPFQMAAEPDFRVGDLIYVPGIKEALAGDMKSIKAYVLGENAHEIQLFISDMTAEEKEIVKAGCLINYNKRRME